MATTYTQAKATLDEIASRSEANRKRLEQARALVVAAESDLGAMASAYGSFVAELDTAAAANAGDAAWTAAKAEKDLMVADFNTIKTWASALKTAYDGV